MPSEWNFIIQRLALAQQAGRKLASALGRSRFLYIVCDPVLVGILAVLVLLDADFDRAGFPDKVDGIEGSGFIFRNKATGFGRMAEFASHALKQVVEDDPRLSILVEYVELDFDHVVAGFADLVFGGSDLETVIAFWKQAFFSYFAFRFWCKLHGTGLS